MSVPPVAQPDIAAEELDRPAWLDEPRSPSTCAGHLRRLGEDAASALPLDADRLGRLWRGIRAEQGR